MSHRRFSKGIFVNFPFRGHLPQNLKIEEVKQVPYSDQHAAQRMHFRVLEVKIGEDILGFLSQPFSSCFWDFKCIMHVPSFVKIG